MDARECRFLLFALSALLLGVLWNPLHQMWLKASVAHRLQRSFDPSMQLGETPEIHGVGRISLGKHLQLASDLYWDTRQTGAIEIGDRTILSRGVHIIAAAPVSIGADVVIGEHTKLYTVLPPAIAEQVQQETDSEAKPIIIGRNVWIGREVTIFPGVFIGENVVISPYTMVTNDVPPGTVVVGSPAKFLRGKNVS
ncbi:MAG TPA: acyltransferase [Methylomirabilota bacterium]|jgi:acetyltransferase-like isoleucine patch superfamily enzyme|nr:acyltransferase [Methylomirabilota bacterium]